MIWEWAGAAGLDPRPLSLRQLYWALDGAVRERWNHTAQLLALIANVNRAEGASPYAAADFHPYLRSPGNRVRGTPLTGERIRARAAAWRAERRQTETPEN